MILRLFYRFVAFLPFVLALWFFQQARGPSTNTETGTFCSNQTRQDLQKLWVAAIEEARESITLAIYGLRDRTLCAALRTASERGVTVRIIFDPRASGALERRLGSRVSCHRRKPQGLMHHKIMVVDHQNYWFGSANGTTASLRYHGNLCLFGRNPKVAQYLEDRIVGLVTSPSPQHQPFRDGQMEFWWLPDERGVQRLVGLIDGAQKSVNVAMFTWTHPNLTEAIIRAHQRGLDVKVVVDGESSHGTSQVAFDALKSAGVRTRHSQGPALLHHKWAWIDGDILAHGSANWTRSAFKRNDDLLCIMDPLTSEQKRFMQDIWKVCFSEARD